MAHLMGMSTAPWRRQPSGPLTLNLSAPILQSAPLNGLFVATGPAHRMTVTAPLGSFYDLTNAYKGGPNGERYFRGTHSVNASSYSLDISSGGSWAGASATPKTTHFMVLQTDNTLDGTWIQFGAWLPFRLVTGVIQPYFRTNGGYVTVSSDSVPLNIPLYVALVIDWSRSTVTLCVNGKSYSATLPGTAWYSSGFSNTLGNIGYAASSVLRWVSLVGALRSANVDSALEWTENPYSIFQKTAPRFYLIPGGGGGGLSPVYQDGLIRWNLLAEVQQDASLRWDVATTVHNDQVVRWNLLEGVLSEFSVRWNLLVDVQQDITARWDTLTTAQQEVIARWNVLTTAQQDITTRWNTLISVQQNQTLRWDVLSSLLSVENDVVLRWDELSAVQQDALLRWNLANEVAQSLTTRWNLLKSVEISQDLRWDIAVEVANQIALQWDLLASLTAQNDLMLRWDLLAIAENEIELRWNVGDQLQIQTVEARVFLVRGEDRIFKVSVNDRVFGVSNSDRTTGVI